MRTVYRLRDSVFTRVAWEDMGCDDVFAEDGGSGPDLWRWGPDGARLPPAPGHDVQGMRAVMRGDFGLYGDDLVGWDAVILTYPVVGA